MFKIGDKVIPISKSVKNYSSFESCGQRKIAKHNNQNYLYINKICNSTKELDDAGFDFNEDIKFPVYILNAFKDDNGGSYYYLEDLLDENITIEEYIKQVKKV